MFEVTFCIGDFQRSGYDPTAGFIQSTVRPWLFVDLQKSQCNIFLAQIMEDPSLEGPLGRQEQSRAQDLMSGVGQLVTKTARSLCSK